MMPDAPRCSPRTIRPGVGCSPDYPLSQHFHQQSSVMRCESSSRTLQHAYQHKPSDLGHKTCMARRIAQHPRFRDTTLPGRCVPMSSTRTRPERGFHSRLSTMCLKNVPAGRRRRAAIDHTSPMDVAGMGETSPTHLQARSTI